MEEQQKSTTYEIGDQCWIVAVATKKCPTCKQHIADLEREPVPVTIKGIQEQSTGRFPMIKGCNCEGNCLCPWVEDFQGEVTIARTKIYAVHSHLYGTLAYISKNCLYLTKKDAEIAISTGSPGQVMVRSPTFSQNRKGLNPFEPIQLTANDEPY